MSALLRSFFLRSPSATSPPSAPGAPGRAGQAAKARQTNQAHQGTLWPVGEQSASSTPGTSQAHLAHQTHRHARHDRTPNTPCTSGTPQAHAATRERATEGGTATGSLQENGNAYPRDPLQNAPRQHATNARPACKPRECFRVCVRVRVFLCLVSWRCATGVPRACRERARMFSQLTSAKKKRSRKPKRKPRN